MDALEAAALAGSGFVAGVMNALAGGGTVVTFPTLLLYLGMDGRVANATSTMALVPGAAASLWVHRREVTEHKEWLRPLPLLLPSLVGGAAGAVLLGITDRRTFEGLAPWLVLFATVLFLSQIVWTRHRAAPEGVPTPGRVAWSAVLQFGIGVYGGYFGAAIGILMLAVLGFLGLRDMHAMNGLKNFLGMCINGVACIYFAATGLVSWNEALVMMVGALAGGFLGAHFSRYIGREKARWAVVVVGFAVTALLLVRPGR